MCLGPASERRAWLARYTRFVLRWRWVVLVALGVVTTAAVGLLPGIAGQGSNLSGILSRSGPTIQVQIDAARRFGLPLLTRIAVVQRDPSGLSTEAISRALARAAVVDRATIKEGIGPDRELLAPYPLVNAPLLVPGAAEHNTAVVTYLFTDPLANIFAQPGAPYRYAGRWISPATASSVSRARSPPRSSKAVSSARRCRTWRPSRC